METSNSTSKHGQSILPSAAFAIADMRGLLVMLNRWNKAGFAPGDHEVKLMRRLIKSTRVSLSTLEKAFPPEKPSKPSKAGE